MPNRLSRFRSLKWGHFRLSPFLFFVGAIAAALAASWQAATAWHNYDGDWLAFFHTGSFSRMPPEIDREQPYRFAGPGYDGQFYHLIAHDPLARRGWTGLVDNPPMRWRRILVPGLAWIAALGRVEWIDAAYFVVVLAFTGLGAMWLEQRLPRCGLAFLLLPATLVSLDRMTVDVALAAFCFASPSAPILALAALSRDSGVCLIAAAVAMHALARQWKRAAMAAAAAIPAAAWAIYIGGPAQSGMLDLPFRGVVGATLDRGWRDESTAWLRTAWRLDDLAFAGIWIAIAAAAWLVIRRDRHFDALAAQLYAALALVLARPQFLDAYSFTRTGTPLMIFVGLAGIRRRAWWMLAPLACALPRLLYQLGPQWKGILRGLFN